MTSLLEALAYLGGATAVATLCGWSLLRTRSARRAEDPEPNWSGAELRLRAHAVRGAAQAYGLNVLGLAVAVFVALGWTADVALGLIGGRYP